MIALIAIRPIRGKTFILLFEQSPFSQTISLMILPITSSMKCIFTTFLIFEWISLWCWLSAPLILHQLTTNAFLRLWLWHRFKSLSLPSWNSSQLDVSDQRRSQVRPSHPAPTDIGLTRIDRLKSCERWRRGIQRTSSQKMKSKSSNGIPIDFYHQVRWTPIWTQNLEAEVKFLAERWIYWWPEVESNHRHTDFQSVALPTELSGRGDEEG